MSFLLKNKFHSVLAETFYNDVLFRRANYYYYIGKNLPWNVSDTPPTMVIDSIDSENTIRNDIVGLKKIAASDISLVVKRIDWQSGVVYDFYDSSVDLSTKNFYVLTDQFNVYKCIDNNDGAFSTVKPTGTSFSIITTADGYRWKYMYSMPQSVRNKFLTSQHMPVMRGLTTSFYNLGAVEDAVVESKGSGYIGEPITQLIVTGTTSANFTQAELIPVVSPITGSIVKVKIKNPGAGYISAAVQINSIGSTNPTGKYPGNSSAKIKPILVNGSITDIVIEDPGLGYSSNIQTTLEVQGDGEGLVLTPFILDGGVEDVIIESPGIGYTYVDVDVRSETGTGAAVRVNLAKGDVVSDQATVEQTAISGAIHKVVVTGGGSDYTQINLQVVGDGTGLVLSPVLFAGRLIRVDVVNPGKNYTFCNIVITGNNLNNNPNASSATVRAVLSPPGGHGKDAIGELGAKTLIMYTTINQDKFHGVLIDNDFRQFGIIKNPTETNSNRKINSELASACFKATIVNTTGLVNDDVLVNNSGKLLKVVQVSNTGVLLKPLNNGVITNSEIFTKQGTTTQYQINEVLAAPEVNIFSGDMLYVSNNPGIDYSDEQLITLKTIIVL